MPYMREAELSDRLGELLKNIHAPKEVAQTVVDSLQASIGRSENQRRGQLASIEQRVATIRTRMGRIYEDKLDGKIDEKLWARKQAGYREQEGTAETALSNSGQKAG
jgi:hypothetical protein